MTDIPQIYLDQASTKIAKAQAAFALLVNTLAGANVIMQITKAGKTKLIADAVKDIVYYGNQGSLYECFSAVERVKITPEMAPFLTEETKQHFKNKLVEIISSL
jgi:hypothetical protein